MLQALEPLGDDRGLPGYIADHLAAAIIEGRVTEGAKLNEVELAEAFATSRTPVREALRILARDGFVVITPRRGAHVVTFTAEWTAQVYLCRAYLQGLAAKLAIRRLTGADLARFDVLLAEMDEGARTGDSRRGYLATIEWHATLAGRADNPIVEQLISSVGVNIQRLRYMAASVPGGIRRSARRHRQLLRALRAQDGDLAESIVRVTVAEAGQALLVDQFGLSPATLREPPYNLVELVESLRHGV